MEFPIIAAIERQINLSPDHPGFDGHFEDFPIFPAICQIELVRAAVAEQLGRDVGVVQIRRSKFLNFIRPEEAITLRVSNEVENSIGGKANWTMHTLNGCVSKGQLQYDIR